MKLSKRTSKKHNLKKLIIVILVFINAISCIDEAEKSAVDPGKKERIIVTSLNNQPRLIKVLAAGGFQSDVSKSGRVKHTSGIEIDFDSITMVLQPNQETYAYTFLVKNSISGKGFTNLILQEVSNGFWGYYLDYETDQHQSFDSNLQNYTGKISRYDLDKKLLWSQEYVNGAVKSDNGRVSPCIEFKIECVEWTVKIDHPTLTFTLTEPCVKSALVMSVNSACALTETVAPGGGINYQLGNGTFIPTQYFSDGSIPGAPTGNQQGASPCQAADGGSGITGGSQANQCNFDIAVVPPAYIPSIEERLSAALALNPYLLLDIPCDQLPKWQVLAQNSASPAIKNKINQLDQNAGWFNDWAIQTLNGANGTIVNMDYFSVNVSTLPTNPTTGSAYTPEAFLDYFRRNINNFVDGSTFSPYCETPTLCTQETTLWNSSDPTGAIVYIDIPLDDGVVVCSEYTTSYWYFMTLEAPGAGNHPVSGTRQFGFESNGSGGYNFFVRGVDRFDSNTMENSAYMSSILNDPLKPDPFFGADALWESFQTRLSNFINLNGGSSSKTEPLKYRTDWEDVNDVLNGTKPVSELGCK